MAGTNVVSGLASGLDWRKIIDQLRALENKKIETIQAHQTTEKNRLSAWQTINTKLLSLRTTAGKLRETSDFNLFTTSFSSNTTTDAEDILSATTSTDAAPGTYKIIVTSLAAAQKLSSGSYASQTIALALSGDIIVGGADSQDHCHRYPFQSEKQDQCSQQRDQSFAGDRLDR